jgi:uncharacterized hydrophobic protein (TIGR00271 family)
MLHVNVVTPAALAPQVLRYLLECEFVINVVHLPGAAHKPVGDLITCDVASEEGSTVLEHLRSLGCETRGTISAEPLEVSLSDAAREAELHAEGSPADAVVWEGVEARTSEAAELSMSFLIFMVLATLIAAVGILTDSVVLIIGAMVVGPEFGPVAGICVGVVQRRYDLAARSLAALAVGLPLGIAMAYAMTRLLTLTGVAPDAFTSPHPQTLFISRPDVYSALIALLAGVAGMVSLTTAKSGALIGVLISVTTVPAAADIAVSAAYDNPRELRGAALQLGINVAMLLVSGIVTVKLQQLGFVRRLRRERAARGQTRSTELEPSARSRSRRA